MPVGSLKVPERRYAVIVDEAHSSQTGEAAHEMKKALGATAVVDEDIDPRDAVEAVVEASAKARGPHRNLSMFAFSATPKGVSSARPGGSTSG